MSTKSETYGRETRMRTLGISLDPSLGLLPELPKGESVDRNIAYGKVLQEFHIVLYLKRGNNGVVHLSENVITHRVTSRWRSGFFWHVLKESHKICLQVPIDFILTADCFATGLVGYLFARWQRLPLGLSIHGDMLDNPYWLRERPINYLFNAVGKRLIHLADAVRVVSSSERSKLLRLGVPPEKIWTLPCFNDYRAFVCADGTAIRSLYVKNPEDRLLMWAGRMTDQKDLPTLLRAFRLVVDAHPGARLLLIGDGERRAQAERLVSQLGLTSVVHFIGHLSYDEMPLYFAACDVFLLSSVYEGNARVVAEAAAAGKPIVCTDVSGARDTIVDGVTGYVVPLRNPEGFAQAVKCLLEDGALAQEIGKKGQNHVLSCYSEATLLPEYARMWESLYKRRWSSW